MRRTLAFLTLIGLALPTGGCLIVHRNEHFNDHDHDGHHHSWRHHDDDHAWVPPGHRHFRGEGDHHRDDHGHDRD